MKDYAKITRSILLPSDLSNVIVQAWSQNPRHRSFHMRNIANPFKAFSIKSNVHMVFLKTPTSNNDFNIASTHIEEYRGSDLCVLPSKSYTKRKQSAKSITRTIG